MNVFDKNPAFLTFQHNTALDLLIIKNWEWSFDVRCYTHILCSDQESQQYETIPVLPMSDSEYLWPCDILDGLEFVSTNFPAALTVYEQNWLLVAIPGTREWATERNDDQSIWVIMGCNGWVYSLPWLYSDLHLGNLLGERAAYVVEENVYKIYKKFRCVAVVLV